MVYIYLYKQLTKSQTVLRYMAIYSFTQQFRMGDLRVHSIRWLHKQGYIPMGN